MILNTSAALLFGCIHIIYIWVNYNDLTVLPHWNHGLYYGESSPFMAELFRLVKYYVIYPDIYIYIYIRF